MVEPHVYNKLVEDWGHDPTQRRVPVNEDKVVTLCQKELNQAAAPKPKPRPRRKRT